MSDKYAVVLNDVVINVVLWDGIADWSPIEGEAVPLTGNAGIGWIYDGVSFSDPNEAPSPSNAELLSAALSSLSIEYKKDTFDLNMAYVAAIVNDGAAEASKVAAVRNELTARKAKYMADIAAARAQYPVE